MSEATVLAQALLDVQKDLPKIHPDASNDHFKNKYVSLDALVEHVLPVLQKYGVLLMQSPTMVDGVPALRTRLIHAESGEAFEDTMPLILDKENSQGQGSAITYARRYSLMSLLGLVADLDDDGNAASAPRTSRSRDAGEAPTAPQKKKVTKLIEELYALEDRQDWGVWCSEFCERTFGKASSGQLTKQEMGSLIEELERQKALHAGDPEATFV